MLKEREIEAKYKIVYVDKQRYYRQSLMEKDFTLECTTPLSLEIIDETTFVTSSWKQLLLDICVYYLKKYPSKRDELLDYIPSWSDKYIFADIPKKNWLPVGDKIYLVCNHTAVHACWILRELLMIFGVELNNCRLIIHRPPGAEPKECREFYEAKTKNAFRYYYTELLKYPNEKADKVLNNIDKLNKPLSRFSRSYDNFYLIDNNNVYASYKGKFLDYLRDELRLEYKMVKIADKYLTILGDFYKVIR